MCVGNFKVTFPVLVAELQDECLLGLDFLDEIGVCLNMRNKVLQLPEVEVPLATPDNHAIALRRVKVAPWSEAQVQVKWEV